MIQLRTMKLVLATLMFASATRMFAQEKDVSAVWELQIKDKQTDVIILYADGQTNEATEWQVTPTTMILGKEEYPLWPGREFCDGRRLRGALISGRLTMTGLLLKTEPGDASGRVPTVTEVASHSNKRAAATLADADVEGVYQLAAKVDRRENRGKRSLNIPVELKENHEIVRGRQRLGRWTADKQTIELSFVDTRIGTGQAKIRKADQFTMRTTGDGRESWAVTLQRVVPVIKVQTNEQGEFVLYSNQHIGDALGAMHQGFWKIEGKKLYFQDYRCDIFADNSFKGRGAYGNELHGKLLRLNE